MKSELIKMKYLISRNIKLYFKDKFTFFISLITPFILFILFVTFLKTTYENNLEAIIQNFSVNKKIINAFTGGWLFSSVLSTSCITVAFCSGMMVLDKITKANIDFCVSPVKNSTLQISYVVANLITTLIVCSILFFIGLLYLTFIGFYLSFSDIILIVFNMILTSLLGCLIANIIWTFASSQGVVSSVCTLISAMYGFICGAYMPVNIMGETMKNVTSFFPGTYATVLFRKGFLNGTLNEMGKTLPNEMVEEIAKSFDCSFKFFGNSVSTATMFLVLIGSITIFFIILFLVSKLKKKSK